MTINAFQKYVNEELGDVAVMDEGRFISPKIQNYWLAFQAGMDYQQKISNPQHSTSVTRREKNLSYELEGVIQDVKNGNGFDDVCLQTIERVRDDLQGNAVEPDNSFLINQCKIDNYCAIVVSVDSNGTYDEMHKIKIDLAQRGIIGTVIFDLLTKNASLNRRYFSIYFDGKRFPKIVKFQKVNANEQLKSESAQFILKNIDKFDLSILSKELQYAVRHGIII